MSFDNQRVPDQARDVIWPTKTSCSAPAPERYPHVVTLNASQHP